MVLLVAIVAARMLMCRVREYKRKRLHPQKTATSLQMAQQLEDVQAADNFRNLFEAPVLFYALVAVSLATRHTPDWLLAGAWLFVALRYVHSYIHCTYNKVMQRFKVYITGLVVIVALWVQFVLTLPRA